MALLIFIMVLSGIPTFAYGISTKNDIAASLGGLSFLLAIPIGVIAALRAAQQRVARVPSSARPGRGTIAKRWETGPYHNHVPTLALHLVILPERGEPYAVELREQPDRYRFLAAHLQPGVELPAHVDAETGRVVAVDWEAFERELGAGEPRRNPAALELAPSEARRSVPSYNPALVAEATLAPMDWERVALFTVVALGGALGGGWLLRMGGPVATGVGVYATAVGAVVGLIVVLGLAVRGTRVPVSGYRRGPDAEQLTALVLAVDKGPLAEGECLGNFVLRVFRGGDHWDVRVRQMMPELFAAYLDAGERVAVWVNPKRERVVSIDWSLSSADPR